MAEVAKVVGSAARVFIQQPGRIAAAWRRVRFSQLPKGEHPHNLLDDVVEAFVCEVGKALAGQPGDPWARTRGVLRLSGTASIRGLHEEFHALRRCMTDALEALHCTERERRIAHAAVDDALDSAVAICQRLANPDSEEPTVPFGGLVIEVFARSAHAKSAAAGFGAPLH